VLKRSAFFSAIGYTILITILSFISLEGAPDIGVDYADKIVHLAIYFLFVFFWHNYFSRKTIKQSLLLSVAIAIIYGIVIEVLQGSLTKHRAFDFYDITANTLGALLSIPIIKLIYRDVKKE
jgi:glycopeptide antibiotics resistance protein